MKILIQRPPKSPEKKQKIEVRIDPWDLWSCDDTLADIIYPLLVEFREHQDHCCAAPYPLNDKEWKEILDKMILSFKAVKDGEHYIVHEKYIQEGIDLFAKYFFALWT